MKKFIVSVVAAGALAVGGAASAQDLGYVLPQILGSIGLGVPGAVVPHASVPVQPSQQSDGYHPGKVYESGGWYVYIDGETGRHHRLDRDMTYVDHHGRRVQVGLMGTRQILSSPYGTFPGQFGAVPGQYGSYRDQYGRLVYLGPDGRPQYVERNGQLVPYGTVYGRASRRGDRDGDGVPDRFDRYPDDPRYR